MKPNEHTVAIVDESACIGCTKCIKACPVDAILGSKNQMHTVIAEECIGCKLCVAPCPVDCIEMIPAVTPKPAPELVRARGKARKIRLKEAALPDAINDVPVVDKKNYVLEALKRKKQKGQPTLPSSP